MTRFASLLLTLSVMTLYSQFSYAAEDAKKEQPKIKVLMIDGQNNHKWQETSPVILDTLNAPGRFEVEVGRVLKGEAKDFKPDWSKYDVVVMNYVGESWPEQTKAGFEKYMKDGGGMVAIHAANNAFPKWKEYNRMTGLGGWGGRNEKDGPYVYWKAGEVVRDNSPGVGGAHGSHWEYTIDLRVTDHPITRGLPASFMMAKEELYDRLRGPAENMTILATAFADPETRGSGRHEPVLMTVGYGKGRVFHTTLGHSGQSMKGVAFQETLLRGTEWAATGDVTFPAVSSEVLPADRAASREPKDIKHNRPANTQ
ncbi:MAG: ThuA domain-containing protein [Planctomycetota bacterium]